MRVVLGGVLLVVVAAIAATEVVGAEPAAGGPPGAERDADIDLSPHEALPSISSVVDVIAAPLRADVMRSAEVMQMFSEILAAGAFGHRDNERAAFIIRRADGSLGCELWPATAAFKKETYHGGLPVGTVAVAHTHPAHNKRASVHDRQEAARIGIPIYVLTLTSIYRAEPTLLEVPILTGRQWYRRPSNPTLCLCGPQKDDLRTVGAVVASGFARARSRLRRGG